MKLSVILSVGKLEQRRGEALSLMLSAIAGQSMSDYELIIVEQYLEKMEYTSIINKSDARCSYLAVKDEHYSTPWGYNIGAKNSSGDILVFMSADLIFGDDYFDKIIKTLSGQYAFGWDKQIKLNEAGTEKYKQDKIYTVEWTDELVERRQTPHPLGGAGASIIYDRDFYFNKLGGHNETYTDNLAWDNDTAMRTAYAAGHVTPLQWNTIDYSILHLFHGGRHSCAANRDVLDITESNPQIVTDEIVKTGCGFVGGRRPLDLIKLKGELDEGNSFRW